MFTDIEGTTEKEDITKISTFIDIEGTTEKENTFIIGNILS